MRISTFVAVVLLSMLGSKAAAWAQPAAKEPTAADKALAETLFREAKKLMADGKVAEACPKFAESDRIDPKVGSLLNLAVCHEEEGKTASAWVEYTEAMSRATASKNAERAQFAKDRAAALEKRLSRVVLDVGARAPGMKVSLGDREVGEAAFGTAMPFDPGALQLRVEAPGKKTFVETITVEPGPAAKRVRIPALADEAPPPPKPPPVAPPAASGGLGGRQIGAIVLGGVGLAGIGVGTAFGLLTLDDAKDVAAHCTGQVCETDAYLEQSERAFDRATLSTVGFAVGGAGIVASVVLLLTAPKKEPEKPRAGIVRVLPSAGLNNASLTVEGFF